MGHHSFNSSIVLPEPNFGPPSLSPPPPIKKFLDPPLKGISCLTLAVEMKRWFLFYCVATKIQHWKLPIDLIWHQAQANRFKNFFEIVLFCREAKYWLQARSMEPTKIMSSCISWHLPLQKILKSVFLIFKKWIAGWIKYEKVIHLH